MLAKKFIISIGNPNVERNRKSSIVIAKEMRTEMRTYLPSNKFDLIILKFSFVMTTFNLCYYNFFYSFPLNMMLCSHVLN